VNFSCVMIWLSLKLRVLTSCLLSGERKIRL
jgi:hypothetical protein